VQVLRAEQHCFKQRISTTGAFTKNKESVSSRLLAPRKSCIYNIVACHLSGYANHEVGATAAWTRISGGGAEKQA